MRAINGLLSAFRCYWTSWLVWLVPCVYFWFLALGIVEGIRPKSIAHAIPENWFGTPLDNLPADLEPVTSIDIGSAYLVDPDKAVNAQSISEAQRAKIRDHYVFRPDSPFRTPGRLPRLNHLVIFGSVDEHQLIDLLEFVSIKSLCIIHLRGMTEAGWSALARQPLMRLEILSLEKVPDPQTLWPPTLQTLIIQGSVPLKHDPAPSDWVSLAGLEQLRFLRVPVWPNAQGKLREADMEALARLPSLKSLYLDPFPYEAIGEIQARLPEVTLRPAYYQRNRVFGAILITLAATFPLCLLLHMLSNQFHTPNSLLTPGFARAHLGFAALLMIGVAILQTGALFWIGCDLVASIAVAWIVAIPLFGCAFLANQQRRFPGFLYFHHLLFPFISPVFLLLFLYIFIPAPLDWFLQGLQYELVCFLFLIELFIFAYFARFFTILPRKLAENSDVSLPMGLFQPFFKEGLMQKEHELSQVNRFWSWMQERHLRAALASTQGSMRKRALLWRAGNSLSPGCFLLYLFILTLGVGGFLLVFSSLIFPGKQQHFTIYTIWPAAFQPLFIGLLLPGILLFQRRPYLAQELLMANSRKSWVFLVFRETALAFYPVLVAMAVALITYPTWKPPGGWPALDLGLLGLGVIGLILASTLLLVTLKPLSQVLVVLGFFTLLMGVPWALVVLGQNDLPGLQSLLTWPPFHWMVTGILSTLGLSLAYLRWMHWELG